MFKPISSGRPTKLVGREWGGKREAEGRKQPKKTDASAGERVHNVFMKNDGLRTTELGYLRAIPGPKAY